MMVFIIGTLFIFRDGPSDMRKKLSLLQQDICRQELACKNDNRQSRQPNFHDGAADRRDTSRRKWRYAQATTFRRCREMRTHDDVSISESIRHQRFCRSLLHHQSRQELLPRFQTAGFRRLCWRSTATPSFRRAERHAKFQQELRSVLRRQPRPSGTTPLRPPPVESNQASTRPGQKLARDALGRHHAGRDHVASYRFAVCKRAKINHRSATGSDYNKYV